LGRRKRREVRGAHLEGTGAVELDPLAEIVIRVLVPVMVSLSQRVMYLQRGGERSRREQDQGNSQCNRGAHGPGGPA